MICDIRIGTSGFHYKHWKGPFYPAKTPAAKMLAFYVQQFDTVELNNSFYRLPTAGAFDEWRESTPANFVFAVKASRFITHNKSSRIRKMPWITSCRGPRTFDQSSDQFCFNFLRIGE